MLRSIELFPEDGSPVGRTPFILSVLTLRSSHPLGGFPPRPPPSFSRLLLARRKYFHDKSRYTRVFMPRWRRPRRRWGFPRLRHRFFSAPHTRSLPPLSLLYHEVEWNWSNVPVFLLFCTLGFLLSVWWGLREFVWGVYVCVCACALCDFWPWWEFCEGLVALQCMRYTYFFDKKEFLPSGLNWFFFFFLEILNLRIGLDWRLKFVIMYYSFNILVPGKWDLRFWSWELVFFKVAKFIF